MLLKIFPLMLMHLMLLIATDSLFVQLMVVVGYMFCEQK